ncbi:hypothetical protein ACU686_19175 [Yinghuangia aomiensis]
MLAEAYGAAGADDADGAASGRAAAGAATLGRRRLGPPRCRRRRSDRLSPDRRLPSRPPARPDGTAAGGAARVVEFALRGLGLG